MRKKRLLTYLIMLVSLLVSGKLTRDIVKLWRADERLIEAQAELTKVQEEQLKLKRELSEGEGELWWERQVRDTLRMAKEGEVVVVVPDEVKNQSGGAADLNPVDGVGEESNLTKWVKAFAIIGQ